MDFLGEIMGMFGGGGGGGGSGSMGSSQATSGTTINARDSSAPVNATPDWLPWIAIGGLGLVALLVIALSLRK